MIAPVLQVVRSATLGAGGFAAAGGLGRGELRDSVRLSAGAVPEAEFPEATPTG